MSTLPVLSGKECVKLLGKTGFKIRRQTGSHIILRKNSPFRQVVVPNHKQLDRGTLRSIIRAADLSIEEFLELINQ
ncbi:MAG: type II toxin-antitoxin system HicA family toxin [Ignavibacteriaceae bacterium]